MKTAEFHKDTLQYLELALEYVNKAEVCEARFGRWTGSLMSIIDLQGRLEAMIGAERMAEIIQEEREEVGL